MATGTLVRRPRRGAFLDLGEAWGQRDLVGVLFWRSFRARYRRTLLGVSWAVVQPLGATVVFTLVFGRLLGVPSEGVPYAAFACVGVVVWGLFSQALSRASAALAANQALIAQLALPRVLLPVAAAVEALPDFVVSCAVLLAVLAAAGVVPGAAALGFPLFALLGFIAALGAGLLLSAIDVERRDVRQGLAFLQGLWLWATPVAYPTQLISDPTLRAVYALNPMVAVVEGARWALIGTPAPEAPVWAASLAGTGALVAFGLLAFSRVERTLADRL